MNKKNSVIIAFLTIAIVSLVSFLLINRTSTQKESFNSSNPSPVQVKNIVDITDKGFSPQTITIKQGETVFFINKRNGVASIASNDHPTNKLHPFLNLGEVPPEYSIQAKFDDKGSFGYHNYLKPEHKGIVIVK